MRLSVSIPIGVPVASEGEALRAANAAATSTAPSGSPMDEAAFREFYTDTAPKLRAYVRRACSDAALADDILQEAFYRFLRAGITSPEPWRLKAYLYRTANTLLVDHWRRLQRERRWSLKQFFGGQMEHAAQPPDEPRAMKLFRRMKPQEQALLWLAYVEGFEHREIAAALHLAEKSVRVLLFRARKKLGETLLKEGFGSSAGRES